MNTKANAVILFALLAISSASNCIAARVVAVDSHKQFVINLADRIGSAMTLIDGPSSRQITIEKATAMY